MLRRYLIGFVSVIGALAQNTTPTGQTTRAITTAVPFLLITPDSRSGALGEAGVAIADNANAMHWNFSTMAFTEKRYGFSLNYTPWLRGLGIPDINLSYVAGYYNLGQRNGVFGLDFRFFSLGNIEFTDDQGVKTGEYSANEFAISVAYTRQLSENFSAGTGIRYIQSNLINSGALGSIPQAKPGRSIAGDFTFFYKKPFKIKSGEQELPALFRAGLNISNIGAKMNYTQTAVKDFIPMNLRLGYALTLSLDQYNTITFTNDLNKLLVPTIRDTTGSKTVLEGLFSSFADAPGGMKEEFREIIWNVGVEYWYNNLFAARAGLFYEAPDKGDRKFMTIGLGIRFNIFSIDVAYLIPFENTHPLQNTLRFSLSLDFE